MYFHNFENWEKNWIKKKNHYVILNEPDNQYYWRMVRSPVFMLLLCWCFEEKCKNLILINYFNFILSLLNMIFIVLLYLWSTNSSWNMLYRYRGSIDSRGWKKISVYRNIMAQFPLAKPLNRIIITWAIW